MEDTEIWKDIPGYNGKYQISSYGRVKSFVKNKSGIILKPINNTEDYLQIGLYIEPGIKDTRCIHHLVAEAFLKKPKHAKYIRHIDGDNRNNRVENLKWIVNRKILFYR